jgi:hypothetical protein
MLFVVGEGSVGFASTEGDILSLCGNRATEQDRIFVQREQLDPRHLERDQAVDFFTNGLEKELIDVGHGTELTSDHDDLGVQDQDEVGQTAREDAHHVGNELPRELVALMSRGEYPRSAHAAAATS